MLLSHRISLPIQDQSRSLTSSAGVEQTPKLSPVVFLKQCQLQLRCYTVARVGKNQQCRGSRVGIGSVWCCNARPSQQPQVVLTREAGKNAKLKQALHDCSISVLELPLVETSTGPDRDQLSAHLKDASFDWIVITSPEAANVFLQGWSEANKPELRIAAVGQGTGQILTAKQEPLLRISFTPPTANAVSLSAELPQIEGGTQKVLYPSSAKAGSDLQTGLKNRGFEVVRLNTYDTQPVSQVEEGLLQQACQAAVIAFASPSAVKAWRRITAGRDVADNAVACIGSTTAIAAEKQGFQHVYFPDQPGIDGFVSAITDALSNAHTTRATTNVA